MKIKDIMSSDFYGVTPDTLLANAVAFMKNNGHSCTLVTDGEALLGIFTERDATLLLANFLDVNQGLNVASQPIEEVMTKTPIFVRATDDILDVVVIANSSHIRHFPVLNEQDSLVGLVTQVDIINTYNVLVNMLNNLVKNNTELQALALEDPLLNIGNRRSMEVDLKHSQSLAVRKNTRYAIAIFDVDFFKKYNDNYGHLAGDNALIRIAEAMKSVIRESDRLYRYGGEEFLVLMPDTQKQEAMEVSIRIRQTVAHMNIEHCESDNGILTISGGVASNLNGSWQELVKIADRMLYIAKTSGRNQVCVA